MEPMTLVIVLTTGETNSMCSSKTATLERTRACLERYENVYFCVNVRGGRRQEAGLRKEAGGGRWEAGGRRELGGER